jgi:hypothetical protein
MEAALADWSGNGKAQPSKGSRGGPPPIGGHEERHILGRLDTVGCSSTSPPPTARTLSELAERARYGSGAATGSGCGGGATARAGCGGGAGRDGQVRKCDFLVKGSREMSDQLPGPVRRPSKQTSERTDALAATLS